MSELNDLNLNKLMKELSIQTLSGFDAETRFRTLAAQLIRNGRWPFWIGLTDKTRSGLDQG